MKNLCSIWTAIIAAAVSTAAFAQPQLRPYGPPQPYASPSRPAYRAGVVESIEVITRDEASNLAGTVIGGLVGGLIGHQIGSGRGRTAATVAGAAGGAVAGGQIEKRTLDADAAFRVTVRLDAGGYQMVTQDDIDDLRTGDRVRVQGGRVYRSYS